MASEIKEPINKAVMWAVLATSITCVGVAAFISLKYKKYNNAIKLYNKNPRISKPRKSRRVLRKRQSRIDLAIKKEKTEQYV